jgi:hypothetical protein
MISGEFFILEKKTATGPAAVGWPSPSVLIDWTLTRPNVQVTNFWPTTHLPVTQSETSQSKNMGLHNHRLFRDGLLLDTKCRHVYIPSHGYMASQFPGYTLSDRK